MQDGIKHTVDELSTTIPELAALAADLVRDLDPQVCRPVDMQTRIQGGIRCALTAGCSQCTILRVRGLECELVQGSALTPAHLARSSTEWKALDECRHATSATYSDVATAQVPYCCGQYRVRTSSMPACVQNHLEFLRIRSGKYEVMVAPRVCSTLTYCAWLLLHLLL